MMGYRKIGRTALWGLGAFLAVVGLLSLAGLEIRILPREKPADRTALRGAEANPERMGQPGQRRDERAQKGNRQRAGRNTGLVVQEPVLGTEKIRVIAGGRETSFTGTDLKFLEPVTITSGRNTRQGWPAEAVLKRAGVTEVKEVVFIGKDGKTLSMSWEKLTTADPAVILTYNRGGGLMLLSGSPLSQDQIEKTSRREARSAGNQGREGLVFFQNIVQIEAKI
jgi:hypothetical protein